MSLLSSIYRRLVSGAREVRERSMETLQFAAVVAIAFVVFHGLEGLLGIAEAGLILRSIAFGVCFAVTAMGSIVALEIAARENSLARRAGRWLRKFSAPVCSCVASAWRAVTSTKQAFVELGVDVVFLVFGLVAWVLLCVTYGAMIGFLLHELHQIGVDWTPELSLAESACAGVLFALFGETLTDRVEDVIGHLTREISLPVRVYLRRLRAAWQQQRTSPDPTTSGAHRLH